MSKVISLLVIALLLSVSLTQASRPEPEDLKKTSLEGVEDIPEKVDEGCDGVGEECLMRRTLAAHTDYIYSQDNKH